MTDLLRSLQRLKDEAAASPRDAAPAAPANDEVPSPRLSLVVGDASLRKKAPVRRYSTGMPELDALMKGGISTRQLAVLMAPPGDGKSGMAVAFAREIQKHIWVLLCSTELETDEVEARIAAGILGCSWSDIVDGAVSGPQVAEALAGLRIRIVGCERLPRGDDAIAAIEHETKMITDEHGVPPLVIVDYLQDLARGTDEKSLRGKIGDLATRLRAMSQRQDCALLAVSSVSRTYYGVKRATELRAADDPTVYLAAAKESGDVDYAAAVVIFLDVVQSEPGTSWRCARLAVAKSRHGRTGFVGARFYGAAGRWAGSADEVVGAAAKRAETVTRQRDFDDDQKVRHTIVAAANTGTWKTAGGWRKLVPGVAHGRVDNSIARLIAAGRLTTADHHPSNFHSAPTNSSGFVVLPPSSEQLTPA